MQLRPALLPALGVFAAAARHQNLAHAAEKLHLTASAVSHHVRKLEALLGTTLFQRHARGVKLTAEGRQLADAASAALADIAAVAGNLHPQADTAPPRITTLRSLSYYWLLPRLPRFCQAHPHVRLDIQTDAAFSRFEDGGPDLGIRYGQGEWPGLTSHHLMDDALFPVASPALPQLATLHHPEQIAQLPLLTDMSPQGWRDWFRAAAVRGVELPPMHTFNDSTDAMRAAVYGVGAVLARKHIAQPYLQRYELVRLPGPALKARYSYYIVHPGHRRPARRPASSSTGSSARRWTNARRCRRCLLNCWGCRRGRARFCVLARFCRSLQPRRAKWCIARTGMQSGLKSLPQTTS